MSLTVRDVQAGHGLEEATESDLYIRFKTLQRQLEFVEIQVFISLPAIPAQPQRQLLDAGTPLASPRQMASPCAKATQCWVSRFCWHPTFEGSRQRIKC